mmetsp:Transcript_15252/g.29498  ORF Transcript_15252/g.29498 Transcript_15252/m.29498 type:complete len:91 (-) Transcript_15252:1308-1580(-)
MRPAWHGNHIQTHGERRHFLLASTSLPVTKQHISNFAPTFSARRVRQLHRWSARYRHKTRFDRVGNGQSWQGKKTRRLSVLVLRLVGEAV